MSYTIVPAIMSGGSGTRLWPLSTSRQPKQFHALATPRTMIQETVARLSGDGFAAPIVICGLGHLDLVRQQLTDVTPSHIVLEPMARNTAAVAAAAALIAGRDDPDALILLAPADHVIGKPEAFREAIQRAAPIARERIVTFGITPSKPETGFGYIERAEEIVSGVHAIAKFLEKPDLATAEGYVAGGRHAWNAGIFLFSARIMLSELEAHAPEVLAQTRAALEAAQIDGNVVALDPDTFSKAPSISIDYAVMEKTSLAAVAPCEIGWADLGSFAELWVIGDKDGRGNHTAGPAIMIDSTNCLVRAEGPPVAVIGLEDIMVISTPSGILVAPRSRAQDVKKAAEAAKLL